MQESLDHDTVKHAMQPEDTPELRALDKGFEAECLIPLWTQLGDLMPVHPKPQAVPHVWKRAKLLSLAETSGDLFPVGRGGGRRAIGLATPDSRPMHMSVRRSGPRSSTSARAKPRPSTVIRRTPSTSSSRARASGPSSTAILSV